MKIAVTLTFDVPDGSFVEIGDPVRTTNAEPAYVPPFADELIPLPDAIPLPGDPAPFRGAAQNAPQDAQCPVHRIPWKLVPGGVSRRTSKPYSAFWGCSERECVQRPSRAFLETHPAA